MARASRSASGGSLRIAVIGGGVIGFACALELRRRGAQVALYEQGAQPGAGATIRAAGMLGLASEAADEAGTHGLFELAWRSASLWPAFASDVERQGDGEIGFRQDGAFVVARTQVEIGWLETLSAACQARDLPSQLLDPADFRREEPGATGSVRAALLLNSDSQVDAALLLQRLGAAAARAGVGVRLGRPVERIGAGVEFILPDGERFDRVLLATGAAQAVKFEGRPGTVVDPRIAPIVPVKGQMLALAPVAGAPRRVIRMRNVYIVPKARWILVGATEERGRADTAVDPLAIQRLRQDAAEMIDALRDAPEIAAWAGVRPGTPDDAPMIGETAIPGVFAAIGHYRNGILLAPATAETVADQMLDGKVSPVAAAFDPQRFDKPATASHSP